MGILTKSNRVNIEGVILKTIATAGLLALALCVPNALQILEQFGLLKKRKKNPKYQINSALTRLIKKGLVKKERGGKYLSITN